MDLAIIDMYCKGTPRVRGFSDFQRNKAHFSRLMRTPIGFILLVAYSCQPLQYLSVTGEIDLK